jgi:hypothetical protein
MTTTTGHHRANVGSWAAVIMIVLGFVVGVFALVVGALVLWVIAGVLLAAGGGIALASGIMEQAY